MKQRLEAMLLIGPTGAGKTPLGKLLESRSLGGRTCIHFDFGENLRRAAGVRPTDSSLSQSDSSFLRQVLETGALLEDKDWPIAERLFQSFLDRHDADEQTLVVLNGLPRHVGQADALASMLAVRMVVLLQCPSDVVAMRIADNAGGDRKGRIDDDPVAIERKLERFGRRTVPLVDHYRVAGATIVQINVGPRMTAAQMGADIERQLPKLRCRG